MKTENQLTAILDEGVDSTHSDGNACQPLVQIFLPNQKKIKLKNRRFKINQRQYDKTCKQCNQDEDKYKKVTRSSYS